MTKTEIGDRISALAPLTSYDHVPSMHKRHIVNMITCLDRIYRAIKQLENTEELWLAIMN